MGEAYRARDTRLGREVAVKVLPHDVADNPERLARFEREAGGPRPRWRPDGKELFFLGPGGRLMVVPAANDFGVPRVLFQAADAADFEVNADGTRFLVHLPERREPVHLLVNWLARLAPPR